MTRTSRRYTGAKPTPIQLTERDGKILECIHAFDGVMSLKQIDHLFFSGTGGTWARERMRALVAHNLLCSPSQDEQHQVPSGEQVYWLGRAGAKLVAGLRGDGLQSFTWRKTARWSKVKHDLAVNDFRLAVTNGVAAAPLLTLKLWVHEGEFLANPDTVHYRNRQGKQLKRQIRPDSFFTIQQIEPNGKAKDFAYLLEIDMATEHNPRFVREKVRPGLAYLRSNLYLERFGYRFGRWLVVTTSHQRLQNMVRHADQAGAQGKFYFTTFAQVTAESVISASIWTVVGKSEPVCLIPTHS